jgi:hypothetical protein
MFDKIYYSDKKKKIEQKLQQIKDQFIVDSINMNNRVFGELQEREQELQEVAKVIAEKEKLEKEKDDKKEAKK